MPLTTSTSVAFCRDLRLGAARLHDVEGFADVEGRPGEWKLTGYRLRCEVNPLGTDRRSRWGHADLGDDPLSKAVAAELEDLLTADRRWCDLADEALGIALGLEREQAAMDRAEFRSAAE